METIDCIFCHSQVKNTNLKDMNNYASHLGRHHQIKFNVTDVIRLSRALEKRQDSKHSSESRKLIGSTHVQNINQDCQKKRYISSNNSSNVTMVESTKNEDETPLDLSKHYNDKEDIIQGPLNLVFGKSRNTGTDIATNFSKARNLEADLAKDSSSIKVHSNAVTPEEINEELTQQKSVNSNKILRSNSKNEYMDNIREIRSALLSLQESEHIEEDINFEGENVNKNTNIEAKNDEYAEKYKDVGDKNVDNNTNIEAKKIEYVEKDKNVEVPDVKNKSFKVNEVKEEEYIDINRNIEAKKYKYGEKDKDGEVKEEEYKNMEGVDEIIDTLEEIIDTLEEDDDIIIIEDNVSKDDESLQEDKYVSPVKYTQNNNSKKRNYDSTFAEGHNNVPTDGTEAGLKKVKLECIPIDLLNPAQIKSEKSDLQWEGEDIPWYHGILYSCQFCKKQYLEKDSFRRHVESKHNLSYGEYQVNHKEESTEKNMHECEICGKGVIWSKFGIENHLRSHEMSLENYYKEHNNDIEAPTMNITDETLLAKYNKQSDDSSVITKSAPFEKVNIDFWYNKCTFQCALCSKVFDSRIKFGKHTKSKHNLTLSEYSKEHGKSFVNEEKHSCQIESCNAVIMWDRSTIRSHLSHDHENLSLDNYKVKYMDNYVEKKTMDNYAPREESRGWASRCSYKCSLCNKEFSASNEFNRHLKTYHCLLMKEYNEKFGKAMSQGEKHSCQVENCNASIWWDRLTIYCHLRSIHDKMSLEEYEEKYMKNYKEKISESMVNNSKSDISTRKMYPIEKNNVNWLNKCTFKCALCEKEINSRSKFGKHIKSEYNLTISEYTKEHGESTLHEERHSCQVESCTKSILWDSTSIRMHLRNVHDNMTIKDYEFKYMDNYQESKDVDLKWFNKCTFKCALCAQLFNSRAKFGKHIKTKHNSVLSEYTKDYGKSIVHEEKHSCQVELCKAFMIWDRIAIRSHLLGVHDLSTKDYIKKYKDNYAEKDIPISSKSPGSSNSSKSSLKSTAWANKCRYKCSLCNVILNVRNEFKRHLILNHSLVMKEYIKQFGRTMSHEEKHSCQVENCNAFILWDKITIYQHLRYNHDKMSLEDYEERYMKDYEEKVVQNMVNGSKSNISIRQLDLGEKKNVSWLNKCTFQCALCKKVINSRFRFGKHAKMKHNLTVSDYTKKHGKSISHEEKHSCQVESCISSILWDSTSIRWHLRSVHDNMSIQEYEVKYMGNYVKKEIPITSKSSSSIKSRAWASRCSYKCSLCNVEFSASNEFSRHIKINHSLLMKEYNEKFGKAMSRGEKHSCQVENCNASIWWDRLTIYCHLRSIHDKMSLEEYEEKYMKNYKEKVNEKGTITNRNPNISSEQNKYNECQFSCSICKPGILLNSRLKAERHMKVFHKINLRQYKEQYGSSLTIKVNHVCHLCARVMLWDRSVIRQHLYDCHDKAPIEQYFNENISNVTEENEWLNQIIFKCKECEENKFETKTRQELWKHVKDEHKMNEMEYRTIHGSIYDIEHLRHHTCQICSQKVNWENVSLKPHIELKHSISVKEYVEKYRSSYSRKPNTNQNQSESLVPDKTKEVEETSEVLEWTAGTLYKCHLCRNEIAGFFQLRMHLVNQHNSNYKTYERNYDPKGFILFSGFHLCKICQKNVKHDDQHLRNHLKEHCVTVTEYFNKYKPKAPKIAKTMKKKEEKAKEVKIKEEDAQNVMNKLFETFPQLARETIIKMEVHNN